MSTDQDLDIARGLADAGIPVFVAYPEDSEIGFRLPPRWQETRPDRGYVNAWRPGLALCAVMGHGLDLVDVDPRNGADPDSLNGCMPRVYAEAETPSGGFHRFIASLGIRSRDGFLPGFDLKAGDQSGRGRGFAFIAPTVRCSKTTGEPVAYRWRTPPAGLAELENDNSGAELRALIAGKRSRTRIVGASEPAGEDIAQGKRNITLASLGGTMRRRGMTAEAIFAALMAENAARCKPPLSEDEVGKIAASVFGYKPDATMVEDTVEYEPPAERPWPEPPGEMAFMGLAGEVVRLAREYTEADDVAILASFLAYFAAALGREPHAMVGATRHAARDYFALVGRTSKARKGDSEQAPRLVVLGADNVLPTAGGLSTGEGLIKALRDPRHNAEGETVDEGVADKRLITVEPEFARVLRAASRQGNTLSPVLRAGWDDRVLQVMTRQDPMKASDTHLVVLAHTTLEELRRELSETEMANGLANRFLFLCVRRARLLPEPGILAGEWLQKLAHEIKARVQAARAGGLIRRDERARAMWQEIYADLSAEQPGLKGALIARAEAHVLRLSMLYAALDGSPAITPDHLMAALELWNYAERSVDFIFGDMLGDPLADELLTLLRQDRQLTRTEIRDLFSRHQSDRVSAALQRLLRTGKVKTWREKSGGRPTEYWAPK